jgi:trigger factor
MTSTGESEKKSEESAVAEGVPPSPGPGPEPHDEHGHEHDHGHWHDHDHDHEHEHEHEHDDDEDDQDDSLGTESAVEVLGPCRRRVKARVPAEKIQEQFDHSFRELGKVVNLPGFRRGRVPRKLLEARFGADVASDLKAMLVARSFSEVVDERTLKVVGVPDFDLDGIELQPDADLEYEIEVDVEPEFELPQYKEIEVQAEPVTVTEEDVDKQVEELRQGAATLTAIEPSSAGPEDRYRGRYELLRDGVRVRAANEVAFQPASKVIEEFVIEDLAERVASWDRSSGDPFRVDVKVPGAFPDEVLRGVDVRLEFHLDEVLRPVLPGLDDDFAKKLNVESFEQLRREVRESLEEGRRRKEERRVEDKVLDKIVDAASMELPETLIKKQADRLRHEKEYRLLQQGLDKEAVDKKLALEESAVDEELRREAKKLFLLGRIAEEEKIVATEGEVSRRLTLLAGLYGLPGAKLREEFKASGRLEELRASLRLEKTRGFLRRAARVVGGAAGGGGGSEARGSGEGGESVEKAEKGTERDPSTPAP